jgi:hypothetical protein
MCKAAFKSESSEAGNIPSDSHLSIVTLCLPTVTSVPGGRVPAGTFLAGMAAGAEMDVVAVRLAREVFCEEKRLVIL